MSNDKMLREESQTNSELTIHNNQPVACLFDAEKYRKDLEGFDISDEQANALLQTLWSIMSAFVDLGFGVDSVQYLLAQNNPNHCNKDVTWLTTTDAAHVFNCAALDKRKKGES